MSFNDPLSPIRLQLMWDRLISVVEEQALTLVRVGFSTSTREAGDLSAGVFDLNGAMLAQAVTGTPGHINSMARAVRHFIAKFPVNTMAEGDIFVTNDPWKGTGHLHDFTFVTPTFYRGKVVALFASTCHVVDVGGRGMTADAASVYEEGIYIPLMRFARAGAVDETLVDLVRANVREPVQVVGDLYSLATCNEIGCRRLVAMMDEFAIDDLGRLGRHILEKSREASLEAIRKIKPGVYKYTMRIDGYDKPLDLAATMTISDTGIDVDFTGTSGPSRYGINVPFCYCEAYSSFGVKCIVAPKVPNNEGSLSVIRISAPEDSNPQCQMAGAGCDPPCHRPASPRRDVRLPAPGDAGECPRRGKLVPVESVRARRTGTRGWRSVGDRTRDPVQRHELPRRRRGRAARQGWPVRHRVPERRAQHAGRDQRGAVAAGGVAQGVSSGFRRRRRVPWRARPSHGGRHHRHRAMGAERLL